MDALLWLLAVPIALVGIYLRWKVSKKAWDWGREHQLDPGPARLAVGLGLATAFLVMGALCLALPDDPWSADGTSIPFGVYGVLLVPSGVWYAVMVIRHRNTPARRERQPSR